jgi:hypothetical protein
MPATAEQWFTVEPPAFIWQVDARLFGALPIVGRDLFAHGHGEMRIKAAALVTIVNASDAKIDHGALLRFLGEMVWFPSAAVQPYVTWKAIDATSAHATIQQGELTATAVFEFDEALRSAAPASTACVTPGSVRARVSPCSQLKVASLKRRRPRS